MRHPGLVAIPSQKVVSEARVNGKRLIGFAWDVFIHSILICQSGLDQSLGSSTLTWPPAIDPVLQQRNEQERHRLELLQQIEENRARKARERQREWEAEERQRLRDELWQQRQRLEMEEERRREREKALAAELKAAKLAAAQRATEQAMMREAELKKQQQERRKQRPGKLSQVNPKKWSKLLQSGKKANTTNMRRNGGNGRTEDGRNKPNGHNHQQCRLSDGV